MIDLFKRAAFSCNIWYVLMLTAITAIIILSSTGHQRITATQITTLIVITAVFVEVSGSVRFGSTPCRHRHFNWYRELGNWNILQVNLSNTDIYIYIYI